MANLKKISIPADPMRVELEQIKERQRQRKAQGIPKNVTLGDVYQALSDILENQARFENRLVEIEKRLR